MSCGERSPIPLGDSPGEVGGREPCLLCERGEGPLHQGCTSSQQPLAAFVQCLTGKEAV